MRVLLAYDASAHADQAVALASTLRWPPDSTVRIVSVVERPEIGMPSPMRRASSESAPELDVQIGAYWQDQVDAAVRAVRSGTAAAEGVVLHGRPARVLVDEAARFRADLVIIGARGHGPIAALVLGSVSAEVVDHARCPVLVSRTPAITSIVFATDGSDPAAAAEAILARWPIFESVAIRIVSIADVAGSWHTGIAPTMYAQVVEAYAKDLENARSAHAQIAAEAAARLRAAGRVVEASIMRSGDAAGEIVAAAEEVGADLIVIGSRGRTGLARMVLGSVARNVQHGTNASVLVVHQAQEGGATT